jgi:protein-tyrosine-phosphatase
MTEKTTLPKALLFACTHNMIRSPIAEGLMKSLFPRGIYIDSCGIKAGILDGFLISVMEEIGIDVSDHTPKSFTDLEGEYFDLIICFSEESYKIALELTKSESTEVEYWPVFDAALTSDKREERLRAYRQVRTMIGQKLHDRFNIKTE